STILRAIWSRRSWVMGSSLAFTVKPNQPDQYRTRAGQDQRAEEQKVSDILVQHVITHSGAAASQLVAMDVESTAMSCWATEQSSRTVTSASGIGSEKASSNASKTLAAKPYGKPWRITISP